MMAIVEHSLIPVAHSTSVISDVDINQMETVLDKIHQFQSVVQRMLKQNHDYGVIPGTPKPSLLKPGAEKILMLMGLRSEFEVVDSTRDFTEGFFQYQVKARIFKHDSLITEGLGTCNTKERRYMKQDAYTIDNTVLKMAKKRALVDATLLVASLSSIFTQDIEDMDLEGNQTGTQNLRHDDTRAITEKQAQRLYAISKGDAELCKRVIGKYGYSSSKDVKRLDYDKIAAEIEATVQAGQQTVTAGDGK